MATSKSEQMRSVASEATKPELAVRLCLDRFGVDYEANRHDLIGRPDIVVPFAKLAVFVHGCFWHRCPNCPKGSSVPRTNRQFWEAKLERNRARDVEKADWLVSQGWQVATVWECQTKDVDALSTHLRYILENAGCGRLSHR